jgi:ribosomal 50S subunit-recycling heat shock protein
MAKPRKSPQQKKTLELENDHFTFGRHSDRAFRKIWKGKKVKVNRQYRRKSDQLLVGAKVEMSAEDVELVAAEITAAHLKESVTRKRLRKGGTVTVGDKIKIKLKKRQETTGRRVKERNDCDILVARTLQTVRTLSEAKFLEFAKLAERLSRGGDPLEYQRLYRSTDPADIAVMFLHKITWGSAAELESLRRNQVARRALAA